MGMRIRSSLVTPSLITLLSSLSFALPVYSGAGFTEYQYGTALGIAAGIKCRVDNGEIEREESQAILEYVLEENKISGLKDYLRTPKAQTAVVIITNGGYLDDKCNFAITSKGQARRLNKVILYYMPSK